MDTAPATWQTYADVADAVPDKDDSMQSIPLALAVGWNAFPL